jgi:hypothetical protein
MPMNTYKHRTYKNSNDGFAFNPSRKVFGTDFFALGMATGMWLIDSAGLVGLGAMDKSPYTLHSGCAFSAYVFEVSKRHPMRICDKVTALVPV